MKLGVRVCFLLATFCLSLSCQSPSQRDNSDSEVKAILPLPRLVPKSEVAVKRIGRQLTERFAIQKARVSTPPKVGLQSVLFDVIADENGIPRSQIRSILEGLVDSGSTACAGLPCERVFDLKKDGVEAFLDQSRDVVLKTSRFAGNNDHRTILLASFRDDLTPEIDQLAPGVIRKRLDMRLYGSAKELLERVFKEEAGEDLGAAQEVLDAIQGRSYKEVETGRAVIECRYWVAIDESNDRVGGIVGLYRYADDRDAEWLNWFAVHPDFRGMNLGGQLLDGAIAEAKKTGRPFLRLFTDDEPYEVAAQKVYESRGLKLVGKEKHTSSDYYRLFRELRLH